MKDTYLGSVYVCSCCQTRKSECPCPCDAWGCDNRVTSLMEKIYYDMGPIAVPSPFVRMTLPEQTELDRLIKERCDELQREAEAIDGFVKVNSAGRLVALDAPD